LGRHGRLLYRSGRRFKPRRHDGHATNTIKKRSNFVVIVVLRRGVVVALLN